MDFVAPPLRRGATPPTCQSDPLYRGAATFGAERGGHWETHHLSGSPGRSHGPATLKCCPGSYCSNCPLQPWSTAPFPSRGRTAWGAGKSRQPGQIGKCRKAVPRLLKRPASPERTSPALLFQRKGTGPCNSSLQSRERRRQLLPPPETHSKVADLSRGAQPPPRPGPGTTGPRLCAPHIRAAACLAHLLGVG